MLKYSEGFNLFCCLLGFFLLAVSVSAISQTRPILVNPNTENSPTNFIFYFSLDYDLPSTDYLMITFPSFTSSVIPASCIVLEHATTETSKCVNLQTGTGITIVSSQVNTVNPNIESAKTIVIQFNENLVAGQQYQIQIITNNVLPNIGSITKSFEFYTITDTGVMIEENWNFGLVFLQTRQNNVLSILNRNSMTTNRPGQSFTNLHFQVTIGVKTPTPLSRLKFIISGDFQFTDSSLVTTGAIIGTPPTILSNQIVSPNVIITTFNQSFTVGRKFSLYMADYLNPLKIATGFISVYHLPSNSMSPVQMNQQNIPITTTPFTPTLTLLTIDGTAPSSPIEFYTNTVQYIQLTVLLPRKVQANSVIKIQTDTLSIHEGSVYFKSSTVQFSTIKYDHTSATTFVISGFTEIPTGSLLTITMEATMVSDPIFKFFVSIDTQAQIATPILYQEITSSPAAIPETYMTLLTGNSGEANVLTSMQSIGSSRIQFTITSAFSTNDGSSLTVIGPAKIKTANTFNGATSCTVAGAAQPCTIVTNTTFTTITIASNSSFNLFPNNVPKAIVINDIKFDRTSSHTDGGVYHLYFSLKVSQAGSAAKKTLLKKVIVIPQRDRLTSFGTYFSNDLLNSGSNFPNIVRLVSKSTAQWANVVQVYERRVISVFAYNKWRNFFSTLTDGDQYPAKSNIAGLSYTFHPGTTTGLSLENLFDWDRIDIILDGSETTTDFSIILPTTFPVSTLHYEVVVGVYNMNTRTIKYLNIQNTIVKTTATDTLAQKTKVLTNKIQMRGASAALYDNIQITIDPDAGSYSASSFSAAIITVSDWQYFQQTSTFTTATLNNVVPDFNLIEQTPLSIYMQNNKKYLTYIPLYTSGSYSTAFSVFLNNIRLPYSHDLPYYSIFLVNTGGTIDCYNQFINQDKGVFYEATLKSLAFNCNVNSLGVQNTYCTAKFQNFMKIVEGAIIQIYFTGMLVSTNVCSLKEVAGSTMIPITCQSNTDKNKLTVTLQNTVKLDQLLEYELLMYGISILNTTIVHYITVQIRDSAGSYIIEKGERILITKVQTFMPVTIHEISYGKNNPIVFSSFDVSFNLPRQLNYDEKFAVVMSRDLANLNTIQSKLSIVLKDSGGTVIPTIWYLFLKNYQIIFEDLVSVLMPGNYSLQIYGIKTPSTIEQDLIGILYLRSYDSSYTISNNQNSTASFPPLSAKVDSRIIMSTKFNTEGLEHQLIFLVQNQYATVTVDTVWIINFPRYYSESLWASGSHEKYCTIDGSQIPCDISTTTPYELIIHDSPRLIQIGQNYTIKIYGITCPRQQYLNGAADYVTESIFFAAAQNSTSTSYIEYSQLFVTESVITIQGQVSYADLKIINTQSSNMQVLQSTFFIVKVTSSQPIVANSHIYVYFPAEFDNFNDIQLTVLVRQGVNDQTYTAQVVNRRIGFKMAGMSLAATTQFTIEISSLPTPKTPCIVDMNKLRVMVASPDELTTTGSSIQLHNLVSTMQFIPSGLHIVINNYQTITLTAGTYSLPIAIQPSTMQTFASNMKISFNSVSNALIFDPPSAYAYLGEEKSFFKIGADQNLVPKVYTFDIIKSETSISAVYASLTRYTVLVSNIPISISIPSSIDVPLGGCSVPFLIKLPNIPFSDISLNFEYDTELFNLHLFWVNQEISYNALQFSNTITERWLSFCSDPSLADTTVVVQPYLSGTNQQAYQLSSPTININIISNSSTNNQPFLTLTQKNIQKTYAGFQVNTNLNGQIYYQLRIKPFESTKSLLDLKSITKENDQLWIQKQEDYLTNIYSDERDQRIGLRNVVLRSMPLEFQDLLPEQSYSICVYFENQHRWATAQQCLEFTTMSWGNVIKSEVIFNSTIYPSQLNKVLCFFVRASQSQINQIVDLQGRSCSLSNAPQNYNYLYQGSTQSLQLQRTLIYFITNKNLTTDPSQALFTSIYNTTTPFEMTTQSKSLALSSFSINYISSSYLGSTLNPITVSDGGIVPSLTHDDPVYDSQSSTYTISNIKLTESGTVYFLLAFNKRILINQITNHYDIEIRLALTPSIQNLLNCKDAYGDKPLECKRIVLIKQTPTSITFTNLSSNSIYQVYYLVANQYPLRPVAVSSVDNFTINTAVHQSYIMLWMIAMIMLIASIY